MANRRMFSKTIVGGSKFLRLPVTARELYFQLGMYSDDDGFCEWYPVLQITSAKEEDLKTLHENRFIQIFDKDVLLILDWKENNYIQADRYTPSKYLEIYKDVATTPLSNQCIHDVYMMDTQVRLGKVRLGKVINNKNTSRKKLSKKKDVGGGVLGEEETALSKTREYLLEFEGKDFIDILKQYWLPIDGVRAKGKQLYEYYSDGKFKTGKPIKNYRQLLRNILIKDAENIKRQYGSQEWL